jgi:hypothetical protein
MKNTLLQYDINTDFQNNREMQLKDKFLILKTSFHPGKIVLMKYLTVVSICLFLSGCSMTKYVPSNEYSGCDYVTKKASYYSIELKSYPNGSDSTFCFQIVENHFHNKFNITGNEKLVSHNEKINEAIQMSLTCGILIPLDLLIFQELILSYFGLVSIYFWGDALIAPKYSDFASSGKLIDAKQVPISGDFQCPVSKEACINEDFNITCNNKTIQVQSNKNGSFSLNLINSFGIIIDKEPMKVELKITSQNKGISQTMDIDYYKPTYYYSPEAFSVTSDNQMELAEMVYWSSSTKNNLSRENKGVYWVCSKKNRLRILAGINDQRLLGILVMNVDDNEIWEEALKKITDHDILFKIAMESINWNVKIAALRRFSPPVGLLVTTFDQIKEPELKLNIIDLLNDQTELLNITKNNTILSVRQRAFKKLDTNSLDDISNNATDPVIIIAARIRLGQMSWDEAFSGKMDINGTLDDVISAVTFIDTPQPTSSDVAKACFIVIRKGDTSKIPELINLLNRFGDKTLAEVYLNSGNEKLVNAAKSWGKDHGYNIVTSYGSNRASWGSKY